MSSRFDFAAWLGFIVFTSVTICCVASLFVIVAVFPVWSDNNDENDNQDEMELRSRIDDGDIGAAFDLAMILGSNTDNVEAGELFLVAAEAGNASAQTEIGNAYHWGWFGFEVDNSAACKWFERAASLGDVIGQFNAAQCLRDKEAGYRDDERATDLFYRSARSGYGPAQFNTYLRFYEGVGSRRRLLFSRYAKVAALRNGFNEARFVSWELGGKDYETETQIEREAISLGYDWAMAVFSVAEKCNSFYRSGVIGEAIASLDQSELALEGNVAAECAYPDNILRLYEISAQLGSPDAQTKLSDIYASGSLIAEDESEAAYWAQRAETNPRR